MGERYLSQREFWLIVVVLFLSTVVGVASKILEPLIEKNLLLYLIWMLISIVIFALMIFGAFGFFYKK